MEIVVKTMSCPWNRNKNTTVPKTVCVLIETQSLTLIIRESILATMNYHDWGNYSTIRNQIGSKELVVLFFNWQITLDKRIKNVTGDQNRTEF